MISLGRWLLAVLAVAAMVLSLHALLRATDGLSVEAIDISGTPATVFRRSGAPPGPAVVIAHGFAGSQQLMRPFALTLARAGYVAVTFDFAGHGRNRTPLAGSITREDGATRTLGAELAGVAARARPLGDGRLAVLGHSMATDIVVRFARDTPDVSATVAVSMFSPAVTATAPRNLLVIAGDWESGLKREALRAVGLGAGVAQAQPGVTYGDLAAGTARRAAFSPRVEHVGVLYSPASLSEALAWLDGSFGRAPAGRPRVEGQGPWILLYLAGTVALAWPLSALLPRIARRPQGAGLPWRRLWPALVLPAVATPLLLRFLPTHFLPVLVGDYLAVHFALYGGLTALWLAWTRRPSSGSARRLAAVHRGRLAAAAAAVLVYAGLALAWPIDAFVTSFVPSGLRLLLAGAMLVGTLPYFLADEWLTRGQGAGPGAYAASKLAFVLSLGLAVALDFQRLFFLLIILPVIIPFFLVFGLFSGWTYAATRHPFAGGIANAVIFAFALAVTFPLLAG